MRISDFGLMKALLSSNPQSEIRIPQCGDPAAAARGPVRKRRRSRRLVIQP